jgi:hypothetical protein
MKNIQVIDGANNCPFSIFQATEESSASVVSGCNKSIPASAVRQIKSGAGAIRRRLMLVGIYLLAAKVPVAR